MSNTEFIVELSRGKLRGMAAINKFGRAADIDIGDGFVDIWEGNSLSVSNTYTFSEVADIGSISSTNTADKSEILIEGLDGNWETQFVNVTLDGTTVVSFEPKLIRINEIENIGANLIGNAIVHVDGTTVTAGVPIARHMRGIVSAGSDQSEQAIYSVPANKNILITSVWGNIVSNTASQAVINLQVRKFGAEFKTKHPAGITSTGGTHIMHKWLPFPKYAEKSDIKIRANSSVDNSSVAVGFGIILIDGH